MADAVAHACATACRVGIFYDTTGITAVVEDNGRGFEGQESTDLKGSRLGLHGMAARVHYLRGELHVESTLGWGTSIRAQVPYSSNGDASRERREVLVACTRPLFHAGLVRLLETSKPSVEVLGEFATVEDLTKAVSLLQPDMILLGQYAEARSASWDTVERPVAAVVDHTTDEQLASAALSGVRGFLSLSSTPAEVARVVVAAARGDALVDGVIFTPTRRDEADRRAAAAHLTVRELEVRDLLAEGLADKQIATRLEISVKTVSTSAACCGRREQ